MSILLTLDKNFSYQQNLEKYRITLIVFNSKDTRYTILASFVNKIEQFIEKGIEPGLKIID